MTAILTGVAIAAALFAASLGWAALILRPMARLTCWSGQP